MSNIFIFFYCGGSEKDRDVETLGYWAGVNLRMLLDQMDYAQSRFPGPRQRQYHLFIGGHIEVPDIRAAVTGTLRKAKILLGSERFGRLKVSYVPNPAGQVYGPHQLILKVLGGVATEEYPGTGVLLDSQHCLEGLPDLDRAVQTFERLMRGPTSGPPQVCGMVLRQKGCVEHPFEALGNPSFPHASLTSPFLPSGDPVYCLKSLLFCPRIFEAMERQGSAQELGQRLGQMLRNPNLLLQHPFSYRASLLLRRHGMRLKYLNSLCLMCSPRENERDLAGRKKSLEKVDRWLKLYLLGEGLLHPVPPTATSAPARSPLPSAPPSFPGTRVLPSSPPPPTTMEGSQGGEGKPNPDLLGSLGSLATYLPVSMLRSLS